MRRCLSFLVILVVACNPSTDAATTTVQPSTSAPAAPQTLIPGGLMPADPATLVPLENADPVVVGQSHDGVVSASGRWAAIRTEQAGEGNTLVSIVDVISLLVVADQEAAGDGIQVGDDGKAVWFEDGQLVQFEITSEEISIDAPPAPPYFTNTLSILPDSRLVYLSGPAGERGPISVVVIRDEEVTVHEVASVTSGPVGLDDPSVHHREFLVPDVAWDAANNRAIVISADDDRLVVVDLASGDTVEHEFVAGESPGEENATRDSYLTRDGSTLFIATGLLDVSTEDESWEAVESAQQLVAVDLSDWSSRLVSATADAVYPSPEGSVIATTGAEVTLDDEGGEERSQSPVYLIDTATGEPLVGFEGRSGAIVDVQFSNDGAEMYVISEEPGATNVDIVDVASEQLAGSVGFEGISLIGEAGLVAFHVSD